MMCKQIKSKHNSYLLMMYIVNIIISYKHHTYNHDILDIIILFVSLYTLLLFNWILKYMFFYIKCI